MYLITALSSILSIFRKNVNTPDLTSCHTKTITSSELNLCMQLYERSNYTKKNHSRPQLCSFYVRPRSFQPPLVQPIHFRKYLFERFPKMYGLYNRLFTVFEIKRQKHQYRRLIVASGDYATVSAAPDSAPGHYYGNYFILYKAPCTVQYFSRCRGHWLRFCIRPFTNVFGLVLEQP